MNLPNNIQKVIVQKTSHEIERTQMYWKVKDSMVQLRNLETMHLVNIKKSIKLGRTSLTPNGFSKDNWINAINTELKYRNNLVNKVLGVFTNAEPVLKNQRYI